MTKTSTKKENVGSKTPRIKKEAIVSKEPTNLKEPHMSEMMKTMFKLNEELSKLVFTFQKEVKSLKEDTLVNAQYINMLHKEMKVLNESISLIDIDFNHHLESTLEFVKELELKNLEDEKLREFYNKKLEILASHIEKLENKKSGFFSLSKSHLKSELQDLDSNMDNKNLKTSFTLNDD